MSGSRSGIHPVTGRAGFDSKCAQASIEMYVGAFWFTRIHALVVMRRMYGELPNPGELT